MDTINLVFKLVNNLKYYLEIDDGIPRKAPIKIYHFQIDSPLTLIVTQARTGAYLQMAPRYQLDWVLMKYIPFLFRGFKF